MRAHPQQLCDRLERLCRVHTQTVAAELCGVNAQVVSRIKRRGFKAGLTGRRRREIPSDFVIQMDRMSQKELERHYQAGNSTVVRWCRELGRAPRWQPVMKVPRPSREIVAEAKERLGVVRAARELGVSRQLLLEWRRAYGLDCHHANHPRPASASMIGWADRYFHKEKTK